MDKYASQLASSKTKERLGRLPENSDVVPARSGPRNAFKKMRLPPPVSSSRNTTINTLLLLSQLFYYIE